MLSQFRTERILPGMFAVSRAGHDKNHLYIIIDTDETYVYIADGRNRSVTRPKRKKYKHIQVICMAADSVKQKLDHQEQLTDQVIADAIAAYLLRNAM